MALAKRTLTKDPSSIDSSLNKPMDDLENCKRKKRASRDDESYKHDEKLFMPQKKRVLGPPPNVRRQNSDDQDDETLIRETQAALKNLSGNWPGGSLYKPTDQDENPTFQNLFEEKNNGGRKMSPTISTTTANDLEGQYKDEYVFKDFNGKCRSDLKNLQKFRRDKDEFAPRYKDKHIMSNYQSHDFTELVDDCSSELHMEMQQGPSVKDENGHASMLRREGYYHKADASYMPYQGGRPTFSQLSAFKPLPESRKNGGGIAMGPYPTEATFVGYPSDSGAVMCGMDIADCDKDKVMLRSHIKEEDTSKSVGSPDSKHYTILQPAGVGSKAASVMQDIAREGVVSVAAVSSTSSPGLGNVSSTTVGDKPSYAERLVPPFSPGSINRGKSY